MDEISIQSNKEKTYLQDREEIELEKQRLTENEETMSEFNMLPGQVCNEESASSSSSSSEFDVDLFRLGKTPSRKNFKLPPLEPRIFKKQETIGNRNLKNLESIPNRNLVRQETMTHLQFLGVKFGVAELKERNKHPTQFLKCLTISSIAQYFLIFITFAVGLKFRTIPLILCACLIVCLTAFEILICQMPLKNGAKKFGPKILVIVFIIVCSFMALFVYSFLVQVPFNSLPLFLLLGYVLVALTDFIVALVITPTYTPIEDPDYQLKFYSERIMAGFFNGTGSIDALSDVVLGLQLIQYQQKKFLVFGILLFVLCNIDYIQVARRILNPGKIAIKEQLFTIVVEIIVMVLTGIVLFDLSQLSLEEQGDDTLMITVISICTTIINFLHNVFLVYNKVMANNRIQLTNTVSYFN